MNYTRLEERLQENSTIELFLIKRICFTDNGYTLFINYLLGDEGYFGYVWNIITVGFLNSFQNSIGY